MKLNTLERFVVNSAPRAWVQEFIEIPKMLKHAPLPDEAHILEVGCGRGRGLKALHKILSPAKLHGFDFDQKQVARARANCPEAYSWHGALPKIPANQGTYDGVFDFGVLHHIENWQEALEAMIEVTKPGGHIYILEYYKAFICNPLIKNLLDHPQDNRFSHTELIEECKKHGLAVLHDHHKFNAMGMVILQKTESVQ